VLCELMPHQATADRAQIAGSLQARIKTLIGVSTTVSVGAPESIERTLVGKARRVIDKRPKS
jgi:phenylacetate-CoA ligase